MPRILRVRISVDHHTAGQYFARLLRCDAKHHIRTVKSARLRENYGDQNGGNFYTEASGRCVSKVSLRPSAAAACGPHRVAGHTTLVTRRALVRGSPCQLAVGQLRHVLLAIITAGHRRRGYRAALRRCENPCCSFTRPVTPGTELCAQVTEYVDVRTWLVEASFRRSLQDVRFGEGGPAIHEDARRTRRLNNQRPRTGRDLKSAALIIGAWVTLHYRRICSCKSFDLADLCGDDFAADSCDGNHRLLRHPSMTSAPGPNPDRRPVIKDGLVSTESGSRLRLHWSMRCHHLKSIKPLDGSCSSGSIGGGRGITLYEFSGWCGKNWRRAAGRAFAHRGVIFQIPPTTKAS